MTAAVLAVLLAGHLVGDWIMQTDRQAAGKTWDSGRLKKVALGYTLAGRDRVEARLVREWWWESVRANQAHMLTYHTALVAAVAGGWAVSTVDKPTSEVRPDRGDYVACYMPLSKEIADRIVRLHNQHLTEIGELL